MKGHSRHTALLAATTGVSTILIAKDANKKTKQTLLKVRGTAGAGRGGVG